MGRVSERSGQSVRRAAPSTCAPRTVDHAVLARAVGKLIEAARAGNSARTFANLRRLVPEYQSAAGPDRRAVAEG